MEDVFELDEEELEKKIEVLEAQEYEDENLLSYEEKIFADDKS